MPKWIYFPTLFFVVSLTVFLRFYNLDWDSGHHLHPDERFLTMVTTDLKWPHSWSEFFNTATSPLNPHNKNYSFYVYGTFPVFVTKFIAGLLDMDNYSDLILVGRFLSGILDVSSAILVFFLTLKITRNRWSSLISLFLYSCLPTAIQLAHFYATDTWVTFFTLLSFYLAMSLVGNQSLAAAEFYEAQRNRVPRLEAEGTGSSSIVKILLRKNMIAAMLGISLGLLVASKISGVLFLPIIGLALIIPVIHKPLKSRVHATMSSSLIIVVFFFLTLRFAQPYLFTGPGFFNLSLNSKVIANWQELSRQSTPETSPPFGLQWIPTIPLVYPALNLFFWGLGIPFSLLALFVLVFTLSRLFQPKSDQPVAETVFLCTLWCLLLFLYQGTQFAKPLRYFYPMIPFLALLVGIGIQKIIHHKSYLLSLISCLMFALIFWNSLAFLSIYSHPHTRVAASQWIYQNIPPGSVITSELWDDGLPLPLNQLNSSRYTTLSLPLYDSDSREKWSKLSLDLASADYLVLTSNRLWRTIASLPEKYPISAPFYDNLLHDRLGFQTVAVFTSYPCLLPKLSTIYNLRSKISLTDVTPPPFSIESTSYCSLALNTDGADETFTVYDHPKVIILKNVAHHSPQTLYSLIYKN